MAAPKTPGPPGGSSCGRGGGGGGGDGQVLAEHIEDCLECCLFSSSGSGSTANQSYSERLLFRTF
ncbi:hypothetical protein Dda_7080 [Drechslerella dactyloides]|uniref:Uncharacterized protein n=1 Tax=Drechslerella dactyloides TaxID=74499 RepID=A0AAD6ITD9_DREDA|nr:hypothetical protein Dda_7080 [Drechslerella dactyloides]